MSPPARSWWLLGLVAVLVPVVGGVVVLATGSGDSDAPRRGRRDANEWVEVVSGLCRTGDALDRGDVEAARDVFSDESHEGLHLLALRAESRDRATVARLLEAKNRVEAGLDAGRADLEEPLRELVRTTADLAAALGEPAPRRCPVGDGS